MSGGDTPRERNAASPASSAKRCASGLLPPPESSAEPDWDWRGGVVFRSHHEVYHSNLYEYKPVLGRRDRHWLLLDSCAHLSEVSVASAERCSFWMVQVCPAQAITIEAEEREDGSRRTTR